MKIINKIIQTLVQRGVKFLLVVLSFILVFFSVYVVFFGVSVAQATQLSFELPKNTYNQDDTFLATIKLNTEREEINAAEINIVFSPELLEIIDFSKRNSVFTLWPQEPLINNEKGTLSFIGGAPGGFNGNDEILGEIIFKAKENTEQVLTQAEIKFSDNSQVLLNTGLGSKASLKTRSANLTVVVDKSKTPQNQWQEEIKKDTIPPEPFEPLINQDIAAFDNKYFIVFSTVDKQTGIDYYEITEGRRPPQKATIPYVLQNQSLNEEIQIKAVDKAGNVRLARIKPTIPVKPVASRIIILAGALLLLIIAIFVFIIIARKRRKTFQGR